MKRKRKIPIIQIWEGAQIQAKPIHKPEPLQEPDRDIIVIGHSTGTDVINKAHLIYVRFEEKDHSCKIRLTENQELHYTYELGKTLVQQLRLG